MSISTAALPRTRRSLPVASLLTVLALAALAVLGASRLPALLRPTSHAPAPMVVTTSFGAVTLAGYELLDGPTAQELGGVTHGIGGYVDAKHALVRVHLTLGGADALVPTSAFTLRLPDGNVVDPGMSTLPGAVLPAGADMDSSLSYVVPRASGSYTLLVRDGGTTTEVPLGAVTAVPRPDAGHH